MGPSDSGVQVLFWGSVRLGRHDCRKQKTFSDRVRCARASKNERQTEFSQLSGLGEKCSSRMIRAQKTLGELYVRKLYRPLARTSYPKFKIVCKLLDRFSPAQSIQLERPRTDMMYDVSDPDIFINMGLHYV